MIIYNVTVTVEESIKSEWLLWMQEEHIPEIMSLGLFVNAQLKRVVTSNDLEYTFAVAYTCLDMKDLHKYQVKFATELQNKHIDKFGEKAVAFRTLMEIIREF